MSKEFNEWQKDNQRHDGWVNSVRAVSSSSRSFSENRGHGQIDISTKYGMAGHGGHFLLLMNYGFHFHKAAALGKSFNT